MIRLRLPKKGLTSNALILLVAAFLTAFGNAAFVSNVLKTYAGTQGNAIALLSLIGVFGCATVLLFAFVCFKHSTKPALILVLLLSSLAAYFMDNYGVVISDEMLQNIVHTDIAEARDLVSIKLLAYLFVLGVAPALVVGRIPLQWRGARVEFRARLALIGVSLLVIAVPVLTFGSFHASFFREHKALWSYANPASYVYATIKYLNYSLRPRSGMVSKVIGADAKVLAGDTERELLIVVVGETARADRFSLNGYPRETNPLLKKAGVISFTNFWACGTSTAVSVPCIFALDGSTGSGGKPTEENLLDIIQRSGTNVLWRDNNSDSKGVALRVPYQDYKSPGTNTICDVECRDVGMLVGLQEYIDAHPKGDIVLVLHQMGNHGPVYYRRYPPTFERFKPACRSNDLSQCSREEIDNAYDNAILYTDYFLAKAIELLEKNDKRFETALIYFSDHGESLGEHGIYLHGLPRVFAPDTQVHVPLLIWAGAGVVDIDVPALRKKRNLRFTHDNIFHTILGFLEIGTSIYRPELDLLEGVKLPEKKAGGPQ